MSVQMPVINTRIEPDHKDALELFARRKERQTAPLLRTWILERLAIEHCLECLKSVGLTEVLRRLSQPSPDRKTALEEQLVKHEGIGRYADPAPVNAGEPFVYASKPSKPKVRG